jgi:hypothetical protein
MTDRQSDNLWHVILGPGGMETSQPHAGMEPCDPSELALELCHMEAIAPEKARELIERFTKMALRAEASCEEHGSGVVACACEICAQLQLRPVSSAVRRALQGDS